MLSALGTKLSVQFRLMVRFLSLGSEGAELIPAKLPWCLFSPLSPSLPSAKAFCQPLRGLSLNTVMFGCGQKLLEQGWVGVSQHYMLHMLSFEGVTFCNTWQPHIIDSIKTSLPDAYGSAKRAEDNVDPLNHPCDELVWTQQSVNIPENKLWARQHADLAWLVRDSESLASATDGSVWTWSQSDTLILFLGLTLT